MKKEFFYNQTRLVDWLDDYRDVFGLEQKSLKPYVSLWLNDEPSLPSGAKHVLDSVETMALQNPWLLCEPPTEIDDLRPREWWHETLELDFPLKTWEAAGPKRPLNDGRSRRWDDPAACQGTRHDPGRSVGSRGQHRHPLPDGRMNANLDAALALAMMVALVCIALR